VKRAGAVLVVVFGLAMAACGTTVVPQEPRVITVPGIVGSDMALEIVDETGELVDAVAVTGEALGAVAMPLEGPIAVWAGAERNEVRLVWISFSCETTGRLTISNPNRITVQAGDFAVCDAIGNHRAVDLEFRGPVNAPALQVELLGVEGKEKG